MEHAKYMAEKFTLAGLKADYLTSNNSKDRDSIRQKLERKEINYLFVVDIFNEGIDIPEIDTVLFLRPTESLTVFLQQLGRGLRLHETKDCLTVLDFVGNSKPEYNFESKFRALIGKTNTTIIKEVEDDFPHLPLGCSIILEKKTKESILKNIAAATSLNKNKLIQRIQQFQHDTDLPLTLANFSAFYNIPLQSIYKRGSWKRLSQLAGKINDFTSENEKAIVSAISNKWLSTNSLSYFSFILEIAKQNFNINISELKENEKTMLLMLHYDVWRKAEGFKSLEKSIYEIGKNKTLVEEIKEVLEVLIKNIDFKELSINLPYEQPLKLHSRYTRDQILCAFRKSSFEKKSSNIEGTAENKELKTEILFINLIKSEENFSPTTMYDDYAVNELLFHWQTQNSARPDTGKGLSYIEHKEQDKRILLFVREKAKNEYGNSLGYVFIGEGQLKDYYGSKPMSINWELNEPIPHYLWKDAAKLSVG
jgi:type I site-specific restriction endonuclease